MARIGENMTTETALTTMKMLKLVFTDTLELVFTDTRLQVESLCSRTQGKQVF